MIFFNKKKTAFFIIAVFSLSTLLGLFNVANAAFSNYLSYQGMLTDSIGDTVDDGNYTMRFRIYASATGGTAVFDETSTVAITGGLFSAIIGQSSSTNSIDFGNDIFMGVSVAGDPEMTPRKQLTPAPFAMNADKLDGLEASSFLRSGYSSSINTSDSNPLLTLVQNGDGSFLRALDLNGASIFEISNSGNVGIGTSTPYATLSVNGEVVAANFIATSTTATSTFANLSVTANSELGNVVSGVWNGTAIGATHGGTSFSSYLMGDIIYASAGNTLSKLPIGASGQVLKISGGVPAWGTDLTGGAGGMTTWSTSTDNLSMYQANLATVVIVGDDATSTPNVIFEVVGNAKIGGELTITSSTTLQNFTASSATTSALTVTGNTKIGTVISGAWNGTAVSSQYGGTGQNLSSANGVLNYYDGVANTIATSSLGLLTTNVAEGTRQYYTDDRVDTRLGTYDKGYFFSTTSSNWWFNTALSGTSSVASITTLSNLSLPIGQVSGTLSAASGGTGQNLSSANGVLNYYDGVANTIATSSLGLLTTNVAEGTRQYYTDDRVDTRLGTYDKGYFFSTTSADYWSLLGYGFSTTSANAWSALNLAFSTSSSDYWKTQNNFFSTTSADYWSMEGLGFSTTSAIYFANASTTIPKTYAANTFTELQTFGNASTTQLSVSDFSYLGTVLSGTWNGTTIGDAYLTKSGAWTGTFDGLEGTDYIANSFSTTSADAWSTLGLGFSTTSSDYWYTAQDHFSTTSAAHWSLLGYGFSTTSSDWWFNTALSGTSSVASITTLSNLSLPIGQVSGTLSAASGGTGQNLSSANGVLNYYDGVANTIATSSLGLLTTNVAEGTRQYYTDDRVDTRLGTYDKGYFFSTTSADYWSLLGYGFSTTSASHWISLNGGSSFSTTSSDHWYTAQDHFSTTSADSWSALGYGFSTTSSDHWYTAQDHFSTTSVNYWETTQSSRSAGGWSSTSNNYWVTTKSTSDLSEGTNKYWTDTRFDERLSATTSLPNLAGVGTITSGTWNGGAVDAEHGGTGIGSYTTGQILYADSPTTLAALNPGSAGTVLKMAGGLPTWAVEAGGGGGSGSGITPWATSSDNLSIFPFDPADVVIIGGSATTTTGLIFEVMGATKFGGALTVTGNTTLVNASTTQISASGFSYLGTVRSGTWNGTAIAVANGGTGATDATTARTNLGVVNYTDAAVNSYVNSSSTIPKTYTTNTFSGANTFSSTLTVDGTLDSNGIATIGDGGDNVTIDSSVWDITAAGVASGFTGFTSTGVSTMTYASTTAITNSGYAWFNGPTYLGDGDAITVNSSSWDISSAGAISGVTTIAASGAITGGTYNSQTISSAASFTGTVTAATSFLAPTFDTASGVAMSVGTVTQTALTIGRSGAATTINGSGLTVGPTAWTATPTISGLITATGGVTSNGTFDANGIATIGDGGDNVTIDSSVWDITAAGVASGFTGFTSTGLSTFANSSTTLLSTSGEVWLGDGGDRVAVNSSVWDITAAGVASGFTGITTTGTLTGAAATFSGTLTANGTFDANGAVTIGDGGDNVTIDSSVWDISSAGAISGVTTIAASGAITGGTYNSQTISSTASFTGTVAVASTFDANGAVTLGDGGDNVTIDSSVWDITAAGVGSGFTGFTSTGLSTFANSSTTLLSTSGEVWLGDGGDRVAVNSSVWDITAAGVASGFTGITTTGTLTGAAATFSGTLTANGTFDANGAVTLGDGGDNVTIDSSVWDISSAGAISGVTTIAASGAITGGTYNSQTISSAASFTGTVAVASTLDANGAVTLGDGGDNVTIDSSVWDITAAGVASGLTGITTTGTLTGAAATFSGTVTANSTLDANGSVTLGDGGDSIAIDSSVWDISAAGAGSGFTTFSVATITPTVIIGDYNTLTLKGASTAAGFKMSGTDGAADGYVYASSGSIGFLDTSAAWALQMTGLNATFHGTVAAESTLSVATDLTVNGGGIINGNVNMDLGEAYTSGLLLTETTDNSYFDIYCADSGGNDLCEFKTGLYVSSGTAYIANSLVARGAITNDTASTGVTINDADGVVFGGPLTGITTIAASGAITAATNETINGIDISSGAISDVTTLALTGAITGGTTIDLSSTLTASAVIADSASATSTFAGGIAAETSGFVYDFSTNKVGIGTAKPSSKLAVNDTLSSEVKTLLDLSTPSYIASDSWTDGVAMRIGYDGTGSGQDNYSSRIVSYVNPYSGYHSKLALQSHNSTAGVWNTGIMIDNNGYVGINDASPSYNLDVTGTGYFSGAVTMASTLGVTGAVTGGTYNSQTISSTASFTGSLAVAGALDANGAMTLGDGDSLTIDSSAFDVSSAGAVSGVTTLNTSGVITAGTDIVASGGDLTLTGTSQITAGGAESALGGMTVDGTKGGYGGINFKSGATNLGTLAVSATYQGFYNDSDNAWDWYFTNGQLDAGTVPVGRITGTLPVLNGGTGVTTSTGSGNVVLSASPTFTGTVVIPAPFSLGGTSMTASAAELNILDGVTGVTAAELSYVGDVTSAIQAQLNTKAPTASPTLTGTVTISSSAYQGLYMSNSLNTYGVSATAGNYGVYGSGGSMGVYGVGGTYGTYGTGSIGAFGSGTTYDFQGGGGEYAVGGTWANTSDRNKKENFMKLDQGTILGKIRQLPITQWNYISRPDTELHIGPMSQDFYTLFGLNGDNGTTSISTVDPSGIALIGLQAFANTIDIINAPMDVPSLFIDSHGNIGIGTSSPEYKLQVIGDIAANSFVNLSTITAKKDISYLTSEEELSILDKLSTTSVARYRYNTEEESAQLRIGLIAENAPSEVLSNDGRGVDIYKLSAFNLAATKALSSKLDDFIKNGVVKTVELWTSDGSGRIKMVTSSLLDMQTKDITNVGKLLSANGKWSMSENGIFIVEELQANKVRVETGVTVKDRSNGGYYCIFFDAGVMKSEPGECMAAVYTSTGGSSSDTNSTTTDDDNATGTSTTTLPASDTADSDTDTTAPVIHLNGDTNVTFTITIPAIGYADPDATVTDNKDTNLGIQYSTYKDNIKLSDTAEITDTSTPATYEIHYNATDQAGNKATEVIRTVTYIAPEPIVIVPPTATASSTDETASFAIDVATSSPTTE